MKKYATLFAIPALLVSSLLIAALLQWRGQTSIAQLVLLGSVGIGSIQLVFDTVRSLLKGRFALDYIALAAISTGVITHNYLVAVVIALMLSGGNALEDYAQESAKKSLTQLTKRLPDQVQVVQDGRIVGSASVKTIKKGQSILVRKGEVIPLDGTVLDHQTEVDESSLTGEVEPLTKDVGDQLRSGTINLGDAVQLRVTKEDNESTYRAILRLVERAQQEKSPMLRLADRYGVMFTLVTFVLCVLSYFLTHDLQRVLAVLVIATPCPLILATPVALIGGVNAAAKKGIILKNLAALESVSRVTACIFDKTGTITLGKPELSGVILRDKAYTEKKVLAIAATIERSSLHPFARTLVHEADVRKLPKYQAADVEEEIGKGISGTVQRRRYSLRKSVEHSMSLELRTGQHLIAEITFADVIKEDAKRLLSGLQHSGMTVSIYTGDSKARAEKLHDDLGLDLEVVAECTPAQKQEGILKFRHAGHITAMIGDGINDAPALALADVGMAFSHDAQTATSEAADIVFLSAHAELVQATFSIARKTIAIALQSIWVGIGLSIGGMIFASLGYVPPLVGSVIQEVIDVAVILNALRASRIR